MVWHRYGTCNLPGAVVGLKAKVGAGGEDTEGEAHQQLGTVFYSFFVVFFLSFLENLLFFEWRLPPNKRRNKHGEKKKKEKEKELNNQGRFSNKRFFASILVYSTYLDCICFSFLISFFFFLSHFWSLIKISDTYGWIWLSKD